MSKKMRSVDPPKVILNLTDNRGQNVTVTVEGGSTPEIFSSIVSLLKGLDRRALSSEQPYSKDFPGLPVPQIQSPQGSMEKSTDSSELDQLSKIDKTKLLIRSTYKFGWFSSKDIFSLYMEYLGSITPSTVSTYLARLHQEGVLNRRGSKRDLEYALKSEQLDTIPEYRFSKKQDSFALKRVD